MIEFDKDLSIYSFDFLYNYNQNQKHKYIMMFSILSNLKSLSHIDIVDKRLPFSFHPSLEYNGCHY